MGCLPKKAVHKAAHPKFGLAVLAFLVMDGLLSNLCKSGILCKVRDVTVHLTVYLYILYNLFAVCLEAAVHVVQMDTGNLACGPVVYFRWYVFAELSVVTLFLPARYQVKAVLADHTYHLGNLFGAVLKVGVHGNHDITLSHIESAEQGRGLAVVAAELYALYDFGVIGLESFNDFPGVIGAAVIHKDYLITEVVLFHYAANPCKEFRN